jgi:hypothetical protein
MLEAMGIVHSMGVFEVNFGGRATKSIGVVQGVTYRERIAPRQRTGNNKINPWSLRCEVQCTHIFVLECCHYPTCPASRPLVHTPTTTRFASATLLTSFHFFATFIASPRRFLFIVSRIGLRIGTTS